MTYAELLCSAVLDFEKEWGRIEWIRLPLEAELYLKHELGGLFGLSGYNQYTFWGYLIKVFDTPGVNYCELSGPSKNMRYYLNFKLDKVAVPKCECGAHKTNQPTHSRWCPLND